MVNEHVVIAQMLEEENDCKNDKLYEMIVTNTGC